MKAFGRFSSAQVTSVLVQSINWGFPKLNLIQIKLIELIWMMLATVNINSCMTSKLPIKNKKNKLPCDNLTMHILTVCSKYISM